MADVVLQVEIGRFWAAGNAGDSVEERFGSGAIRNLRVSSLGVEVNGLPFVERTALED